MMPLFAGALTVTLVILITVLRGVQARMKSANPGASRQIPAAARYRPMLRLLTEHGIAEQNTRSFRARRRAIFRRYLRCLTRDYAHLLAGVRLAMTTSGFDRPELVKALARSRFLFMVALCRIEFALAAHAVGIDTIALPDLSGLITGLDVLRAQMPAFEPSLAGAR